MFERVLSSFMSMVVTAFVVWVGLHVGTKIFTWRFRKDLRKRSYTGADLQHGIEEAQRQRRELIKLRNAEEPGSPRWVKIDNEVRRRNEVIELFERRLDQAVSKALRK